ncbi:MAG: hypothetical protein M3N18_01840 [Actinomycetota bacterium]|nr:hypothetical protein [Actinomycetota bacterium]
MRKKAPLVPDPGQRVRLRAGRGRWRGRFRAVSYPYTDEAGVVVVRVAEEGEYRDAIREGRRAVGVAWPAKEMEVVWPPEGGEQGGLGSSVSRIVSDLPGV